MENLWGFIKGTNERDCVLSHVSVIIVYADDATLNSKCYQASDQWQQLELTFELEPNLQDTVDWSRKWLGKNGFF